MRVRDFVAAAGLWVLAAGAGEARDRILRAEMILDAPVERVWSAWTTEDGIRSFFARGSHIEPRVDGAYEIFFDPSEPPGKRGGDGMRVLGLEPPRRLVFTWNAPPDQPFARAQRTVVALDLEPAGEGRTRLRFSHSGWGEGPEWDKAFAYFDDAWGGFVLPNLRYSLAHGPIDWARRPQLPRVAETLAVELVERRP
jgi:uncharacterized protein YndB with AHSA1/START domain